MIYFINTGLNTSNSGIEHAEFDRARLFRKHQVPFKLVTSVFIPQLHDRLAKFNLRDIESCNMFDYFQKALSVHTSLLKLQDIDFGIDAELNETSPRHYNAMVNQRLIGRVIVDTKQRINRIEYFEGQGNLYKVEIYDVRGFKSLTQYYSPDNHIEVEVWSDIYGKPVIEKTYALTTHNKVIETWKVNQHIFNNLQSFRKYFYDCLNATDSNMFLIDRSNVSEWQLLDLKRPAYIAFMMHNHQGSDSQNPNATILNDNYEWAIANIQNWNCVISATPQQTHDMKTRWSNQTYFTVPVGVIPDVILQEKQIPMSQRHKHSMLVTARIAPEKGIDKIIEALAIAQKHIPDLTLDVYGYVDHSNHDATMNKIKTNIKNLPHPKSVTIHEHTDNVHKLQQQSQVYLIYSRMEGFNLALMEAQSAGMVGLTNDVNYGPNELVKNGKNGYITPYDDVEIYAQKMIDLFSDDDQLQQFSTSAYELSHRYSETNVWQAWQTVLNDYHNWCK